MKSSTFLMFLVSSIMIIAIVSILVKPATAEDPIIVGKWDRLDGADVYTIFATHVTQTVIGEQIYHGTWEYDGPSGYKYIFHWEHSPPGREPFIDYVTVAADGQSYSGYNNYGDNFNCVRLSNDADSTSTADSGGFPIFYVAVGGGIAAVVVVGAAIYFFFIAGGSAGATAAGALGGGSSGAAGGALESLSEASTGGLAGEGLLVDSDVLGNVMVNLFSETIMNLMSGLGYDCSGLAANDIFGSSVFASPEFSGSLSASEMEKQQAIEEVNAQIQELKSTLEGLKDTVKNSTEKMEFPSPRAEQASPLPSQNDSDQDILSIPPSDEGSPEHLIDDLRNKMNPQFPPEQPTESDTA
jgi:hypothetical protein